MEGVQALIDEECIHEACPPEMRKDRKTPVADSLQFEEKEHKEVMVVDVGFVQMTISPLQKRM